MNGQPDVDLDLRTAQELLFDEADALDQWRLHDWLEMFTADAMYWVPTRADDPDPSRVTSHIYDDRQRMEERVWRLTHGPAYSQVPRSNTQRILSNIRVRRSDGISAAVSSNFAIHEIRREHHRIFAGRCEHHLRKSEGIWKFQLKKVVLVNCDDPMYNLTFVV